MSRKRWKHAWSHARAMLAWERARKVRSPSAERHELRDLLPRSWVYVEQAVQLLAARESADELDDAFRVAPDHAPDEHREFCRARFGRKVLAGVPGLG